MVRLYPSVCWIDKNNQTSPQRILVMPSRFTTLYATFRVLSVALPVYAIDPVALCCSMLSSEVEGHHRFPPTIRLPTKLDPYFLKRSYSLDVDTPQTTKPFQKGDILLLSPPLRPFYEYLFTSSSHHNLLLDRKAEKKPCRPTPAPPSIQTQSPP